MKQQRWFSALYSWWLSDYRELVQMLELWNLNSLKRLIPIITPYKWLVGAGFASFFVARFFEIGGYYLVAMGVDAINTLINVDLPAIPYSLAQISIAIVFCVVMRFFFVVYADARTLQNNRMRSYRSQ